MARLQAWLADESRSADQPVAVERTHDKIVVAASAQDDARSSCAVGTCSADKTKVRALDTIALVSWVAAAGAATLAVVLWTRPSSTTRAALTPNGMRLEGTF